MTEPDAPRSMAELRERMDRSLAELLAVSDQPGDSGGAGWSAAAHLAHLAAWADGVAALLRRQDRWAAMGAGGPPAGDDPNLERFNAQLEQRHHRMPYADARAWLAAAHTRLAEAAEAAGMDGLELPYDRYVAPFTGDGGAPLLGYVIGDSYEHYDEHRGWLAAQIGGAA